MVVLRSLPRRPLTPLGRGLTGPAVVCARGSATTSCGRFPAGTVVALGIFDGVHRGHQAILKKASVAVTFHPHPLSVLRPRRHRPCCRGSAAARVRSGHPAAAPALLMPLERRLQAFSKMGIKTALVVPFTRSFSKWSPERFVEEILVRRLRAREVIVGFNFRFGHGRRGTVKTLERLGRQNGFRVRAVAPVRSGGTRVSSGKLREWIRQGKLQKVRRLMKGPAIVAGRVVRGEGRGRSLGFATANLRVESGLLPPVGVYAVRVWTGGRRYAGMANLGFRPTFWGLTPRGQTPPGLEVHLFGLNHPLYRKRLEVEFVRRLRAERRFSSPRALARQLVVDARRAKWYSPSLNN